MFTELDAEWKVRKRLIRGYGIAASERLGESEEHSISDNYHYYHQNEHGDMEYITGSGGKVENAYTYDAFGNITNAVEVIKNRYTYNGEQYDNVTSQYYLRARFYNPLIGRFTQEDVYRGDGLNLYAYCGANPVMYVDPSGYDGNQCETQKKDDNILKKPVTEWTNQEIQKAVDSVHNAVYGTNGLYPGKGGANPFSLIVTKDRLVVLSSNNQYPTGADSKMTEIFGKDNYVLVDGTSRTNYTVPDNVTLIEGGFVNHAEPRAIQKVKDIEGDAKGAREACSHLSCESCTEIMEVEGVENITGSVTSDTKGKRGRYKREYVPNLW